ncbi:MAG: branched-chain amino acid ABC transporter permease [Promethearchaeota archaeon]
MSIEELGKNKTKIILIALVALFLFAIPVMLSRSALWTRVYSYICIFCILASALNLMVGFTGQLSLGIAAIAGMSAYTSAYLMMAVGLPFWLAFPAAALTATALGIVLGFPGLRLRGFYFAMATLLMQNVIGQIFLDWVGFTKGDMGLSGIPPPNILGVDIVGINYAYLCLGMLGLTLYVVFRITNSNLGIKMTTIKEDDILAGSLGINVARTKLIVYAVSSFFIGVGGSLLGHLILVLTPRQFTIGLSFQMLVQIMVGGSATIIGPLIGAALLTALPYLIRELYLIQDAINGFLLIIVAISIQGGIYGRIKSALLKIRKKELAETERVEMDLERA